MTAPEPRPPDMSPSESSVPNRPPSSPGWHQKLAAILICVFCYELGIFLLVYPWMDAWGQNFFILYRPEYTPFLLSFEFRGAMSGLGILNLFIAFAETFRLRRFAARGPRAGQS